MIRNNEGVTNYESHINRKRGIILILIISTIGLALLGLCVGSSMIPIDNVLEGLFRSGRQAYTTIVWDMRMPRILTALVAGAGLAVSGCVMQNNLRNPLASPSTLGISNAAAFGANVAIILFGAGTATSMVDSKIVVDNPYLITTMAFGMSMITMVVIVLLSKATNFSPSSVVLAGVAVGSIFSAGTTILQFFATDSALATAVFWSFGDLSRVSMKEMLIIAAVTLFSSIYFYAMRWNYNALANGEELAKSLGVNTNRLVMMGLILTSLITAVCISFMGVIGFIGLVAPQIMRIILGDDHRFLIPASMLAGGIVLLLSDIAANVVIAPAILPVGAITSLLGGPMFLYLLIRGGRNKKCRS